VELGVVETPIDFSILTGQGAPVLEFKAGEVIFDKEDSANVMYIIKSGKVEIRLGNRLLETVSPNNIFGEMALVDPAPRSATAIAATDVQIVPVGEKQFAFLVSQTPYFALKVLRVMTRRLRTMDNTV
jgi:CRP-like cAMP-binding protein